MKKLFVCILAITCLFMVTGCTNKSDSYLKDLSYEELNKKLSDKETFFFVVTQDGCSHCENFLPVLENVLNDKKVIGYNLNTSKLSEEQNKEFDEKYNVTGTPTTIFIKDGEEVSLLHRINGEADSDKVIRKLQNNGYIK